MTGADDNLQTADFRADGVAHRLFIGPRDGAYTRVLVAFVVASASHLWLADAAQPDWMPSNVIYIIGLVLLVLTRGAIGWFVCAVALSIPLLFLRDQLTQSGLLLAVCIAGGWALVRRPMDLRGFVSAARGLLVVTYVAAAFHKLNQDFFDPAVGCASYGLRELATYYRLDPQLFSGFDEFHAVLAVTLELAIPIAYLLGRRNAARLLAVVFHIPLTTTMAPAFAFVMAVGHAAYLTDEDVDAFRVAWRRRRGALLAVGLGLTAGSLLAHGEMPEWTMIPREATLWLALVWTIVVTFAGPDPPELSRSGWMPRLIVGAFALNCMTPYLGIQFQHTGAMLSNLRIDTGCWNHYVMPEALRITDDYVRVDEVMFRTPGAIADYEQTVLEQLWSPPQFRQMQRNWCRPEIRPFAMSGVYRGERWAIEDLCDPEGAWPFGHAGVFGVEVFGDFLRFQKNLTRECPQMCIH